MALAEVTTFLSAAKSALDIFRGIRAELPQGAQSEAIAAKIEEADKAVRTSEAELAKALGYRLCRCTFPPQIMLWRQDEQATVCSSCGNRLDARPRVNRGPPGGSWMSR